MKRPTGWLKYLILLVPGAPILYYEGDRLAEKVSTSLGSLAPAGWIGGKDAAEAAEALDGAAGASLAGARDPSTTPPSGAARPPIVALEAPFDFAVNIPWVLGRWPRVTTQLSLLELQGYRVPLVTGTRLDDLDGSLTYYFDSRQVLQRITFHGTTGDTRRLVALLERRFGFQRYPTTTPNVFLYQTVWDGKPRGQLWIQPAPVVDVDKPHERFEINLAIDRPSPSSPYGKLARRSVPP